VGQFEQHQNGQARPILLITSAEAASPEASTMNRAGQLPVFKRSAALTAVCLGVLFAVSRLAWGAGEISPKPAGIKSDWGDQGDGTFVNPILPGDFSDLDAIRVGEDYYAISSTFQYSPGMVILHSRDLVNWTILGHAVNDVTSISPEMNWDRMDRYGRGIWAGAVRFHAGRFWIFFGTPDEGFFMTTATNPAGPWEPVHQLSKAPGWDDCCPFWDDDGQGYFICSNPSGNYAVHLFKLSTDGRELDLASDRIIHQSKGSEANKLYKFNGIYYHYYSEVHGEGRVAMMERSRHLQGPWETAQLNHVRKRVDQEPNQGGFLDVPSNGWWFLTHQGEGDWDGRAMALLPVTWTNGWPIIGKTGSDGIGNMVWTARKPISGSRVIVPQTDDEFDEQTLPPQWEWNYQPRANKWSLTERPGFLRLHAFKPVRPGDLLKAGNTLTQRVLRTSSNQVTIKLEVDRMSDDEQAGLCHLARDYAAIGILQSDGVRRIVFNDHGKITVGPALAARDVWLRSNWDFDGVSQFAYSTDGASFIPFGPRYQLTWSYYRGDRIAIFNFNDRTDTGHVDVDWFHYKFAGPAER
jgi:beta-xylosidase